MKQLFRVFTLFFIATLFINCEQELQVEEETATANATAGVNATIRRNKLKQRNNGLFKNVITVSDPFGMVASMDAELFATNGILATPNLYFPDLVNENDSIKKFRFNQLNFENGEAAGWPFMQKVTLRDPEGESVGEPIENWVTAQDNDAVDIASIRIIEKISQEKAIIKTRVCSPDSTNMDSFSFYFTTVAADGTFNKERTGTLFTGAEYLKRRRRTGLCKLEDYNIPKIKYQEMTSFANANNEVGIVLEVRNEQGVLMDNDLFVVSIESGEPEGIAIKNTKHVIKPNGNHRIKVRLEGTEVGNAAYAELVVEEGGRVKLDAHGEIDFLFVSGPEIINTVAVGDVYIAPVFVYNEFDELIATLEAEFTVTTNQLPEDTAIAIYEGLSQNSEGGYTFRAAYQWDLDGDGQYNDANEPNKVFVAIEPVDGGSETETEFFELNLVSLENTRSIYEGEVPFVDSGNVSNKDYNLVMTRMVYLDEEKAGPRGNTIRGQEEPFSIVRTCMTNGGGSDLFNYSIDTNEIGFQNTDIVYVSFTTASGEVLTLEPNYPMFRTSAQGDFINFQAESLSFLDLTDLEEETTINVSVDPNFGEAKSILFKTSENIHELGFLNSDSGKWECQDECLSSNNGGDEYCGETDHF